MAPAVAPYGSWPSPITAEVLVADTVRISDLRVAGGAMWWVEGRPAEGGRHVVVRRRPDGTVDDLLAAPRSARTTVHEYGGAPFTTDADGTTVWFSDFADQRLWRVDAGGEPRPVTPEPPVLAAWRYADARVVAGDRWLVAVRERHHGPGADEVVNDLVAIDAGGEGEPVVLAAGRDFFAAPRPSPDGRRVAWLAWDHPNMPWDGTELWVADLVAGAGGPPAVVRAARAAGGADESVSQPRWSPAGRLHWVSDRSGWWNLYADDGDGSSRALIPMAAEFSRPDWVFGQGTYDFLADGRMVVSWTEDGNDRLGVLDPETAELRPIETPFTSFGAVCSTGGGVVALAASPVHDQAVVAIALDGASEVLRPSRVDAVDPSFLARPRAIVVPTTGGESAHALHYPPANPGFEGPPGERPPLIVMSHGGPTSSASSALDLGVQFWTSRGIAVVDVDYRGSSGHGRAYRRRLEGNWGVVDVDDCVAAARFLAGAGEVDGRRMAIRGGSAGGYTTLCALVFRDMFAAGASRYGVADLEALASDTHKFESRYLDRLVGPWPEARWRYRERSPIHHADGLSCPVILLQGAEDRVVPPAQAEVMAAALRAKGLPFAHLVFEGEQHGFRRAETIRRAAEAELSFLGQVLGFEPADDIEPVAVENLSGSAWPGPTPPPPGPRPP
jgi:dipeptidyl aminopeptidase/acylaminoacyl peptidase